MDGKSGDEKKSVIQKLFTLGVSPDLRARMEAESRTWMVQCARCGYEQSVWDTGGVRYKASGASRQYRQCPKCGQRSWHKVYRSKDAALIRSALPISTSTGERRRTLPCGVWLGIVILGFAALLGTGIFFLVNTLTQPVVASGDNFMSALKMGDYTQAYSLCTPELQKELGNVSDMAILFQDRRPTQWNWTSRNIRNGIGQVDGDFTYSDGKTGNLHLLFSQVNNDWKISSFRFNPN